MHVHTSHLVIYVIYVSFSINSIYYILFVSTCSARWREEREFCEHSTVLWTFLSPSWLWVSNRMFWLPHSSPIFGWKCNCTLFLILKCHSWANPSPWAFQRQRGLEWMNEGFPISKPHQNPHNWDFRPLRNSQQFSSGCDHGVRKEADLSEEWGFYSWLCSVLVLLGWSASMAWQILLAMQIISGRTERLTAVFRNGCCPKGKKKKRKKGTVNFQTQLLTRGSRIPVLTRNTHK